MTKNKTDLIQFLEWTRNGIAFSSCWLLILWLAFSYSMNIESISTDSLIKMMLFVTGGVLIFSSVFTRVFIKKWRFITRLTCFMILFCIYECFVFYTTDFFQGSGSMIEWIVFVGGVLISYLICITIYHFYSNKKGEIYTQALQTYQSKRKVPCE